MSKKDKIQAKEEIFSLLNAGKFREAAVRAKALTEQFPDDYEFPLMLGVALIHQEKYDKARRALVRAIEQFPKEWDLRLILGNALGFLADWRGAEGAYRKALDLARDASPDEIADIHCSLAETLWEQRHKAEALAEWQEALEIDPRCKEAKDSLAEHTNVYGEPRALNAVFDDLYHFQNIQTKRYYDLVGREEFNTKEEAEFVVKMIMAARNERVSPASRNLDGMTAKQKDKLFRSITLDFAETVGRWKK